MYIEMFPTERIELHREVGRHPALVEILSEQPSATFEEKLAHIATYCNVLIDGDFTQREINQLCDILIRELQQKRTGFILLQ
jgi:hypothetical protein